MGKFMKKSRTTTGEIAVMEVVSRAPLGVRTRAQSKTLALQSSNKPLYSPSVTPAGDGGGSYLELRSRRLAKTLERSSKREKKAVEETCASRNPNPNNTQKSSLNSDFEAGSRVRNPSRSCSVSAGMKELTDGGEKLIHNKNSEDFEAEASFGQNLLEIEGGERTGREPEPVPAPTESRVNLQTLRTPDSTTTHPDYISTGTIPIPLSPGLSHPFSPTAREIDDFFAKAEEELHKEFIKKYNFDPVNDKPLPGRYQWEKVNH